MDELREWSWLIYPLLIGYFLYEVFKWLKNVFLSIKYYKDRFDYDYEMIDKRMDIIQTNLEILKCMVKRNNYEKESIEFRDKREELEEELLDLEVDYERMVESRSKLRRGFDIFADAIEREKKKNRKKNLGE